MFRFQLITLQWVKIGVEKSIEVTVSEMSSDKTVLVSESSLRVLCSPGLNMAHNKHDKGHYVPRFRVTYEQNRVYKFPDCYNEHF